MSWTELAEWIDAEGGLKEFFYTQCSSNDIFDPDLQRLVIEFQFATGQLQKYLEKKGGLL